MKMNELDESIKQDVAEDTPDQKSLRMQYPHYYKNKDAGTVFRTQNADGQRMDITPDDEEWDDYYKQQFPDMPTPDDAENGFYSDDNTGAYVEETKGVAEAAKKGLYYYVNKRKKAGTSRSASSPKAPSAQAWKDAAKTAKKESVIEMRDRRDAYQRDYDSSQTGFSRPPREMDEANLMYRYDTGDGKVKQRMIDNHDEKSAHQEGFRDSIESALKMHGIIRSKFDSKKWVQKQGDKWLQVFPFGNPKDVSEGGAQQAAIAIAKRESGKYTKDGKRIKESATVGATSAANIASVANPTQAHSKKPVKSVNALDQDEVSLFGAPMETVKNTAGKKAAIIKRR